ncbi:MAG: nucleotidyltransferase domain-containing protein [Desulfocucumaceae bacterium]
MQDKVGKARIQMVRNSFYKDKQKKYHMVDADKNSLQKNLADALMDNRSIIFTYVHGSFLTEVPFGDIDIAIYLDETALPGESQIVRQELSMEMEMEDKFGYPFDVRVINGAPLSFRYNVLKNGKLLFSRDEDLSTDFAARTIDDYIDFLPYRKRYLREVLNLEI